MKTIKSVWHPFTAWECFHAGMYSTSPPIGMTADDCRDAFAGYFMSRQRFAADIENVFSSWPISCEHFLTKESLNRVAWLGQACVCYATGVPACFKAAYVTLPAFIQDSCNALAKGRVREWEQRYLSACRGVLPNMDGKRLFE